MNLDNAIKKSLYDGDIKSVVYNPNIVINEYTKNIREKVQDSFRESDRIDIAVSYVVWSGLSLIYNDLKKFDESSRILLTIDGMVTDPRSLQKLLELNLKVKVYVPTSGSKGFHLKSYLFEKASSTVLLIGSSNISSRAFGEVHEMAVEIDSLSKGYIVEKYNSIFEELWNDSCSQELTENFIINYEELFKQKRSLDKKINDVFMSTDLVKPNYMQQKALEELEECRRKSDRGLVIAATGTGKTYLSAFDVENSNSQKVLFLVHNRLILSTAMKTYRKIFKNKKMIELDSTNKDDIFNSDFIFTTDKTAFNILMKTVSNDYFDYVIYDEAHKIGMETKYKDLINYFKPKFTLGITATPERTDNPDYLFNVFDYQVPYEIRLLDALEHELVCPFTYYGFNLDDKLLDVNEKFDYGALSLYLKKIISEKGHYDQKLRCLVFCSNVEEAQKVSNALNSVGYNSKAAVSGKEAVSREEIESYIKSIKSDEKGSVEIICVVNKFNEGVDIPDLNMIIMLRNTTSSIIYLQQLGRGLRKTEDPHKFVTIIDIIGNSNQNYSIAEVLTGNITADKRKLYMHANTEFKFVSPFINVYIEKKAIEKIIRSISNHFKVQSKLKNKFKDELYRFKEIPSLVELSKNANFKELELLQLLFKNFYTPFENYYAEKYNIEKNNLFISNFFTLISQFVFRGYDKETLLDYVSLLKGNSVKNDLLRRILLSGEMPDGISTSIYSNYHRKSNKFVKPFLYINDCLVINEQLISELKINNGHELFKEHIELFEEVSKRESYEMKLFDLVDKGEFLLNSKSNDCYMNVVGERIDRNRKKVFCTIKISTGKRNYDNKIIDDDKILYYTQSTTTLKKSQEKVAMFLKEDFEFHICAQFPHLGYSSTSYFNLGEVEIYRNPEFEELEKGKFSAKIIFKLSKKIPPEFLLTEYSSN